MKTIYKPMLLILALTVSLSSCIVSKKEYLLKEGEARSCAERLTLQVEDNKALRTELSRCQDDLASSGKRVNELTASLGSVSDERDLLQNNLTVEKAVNQELKSQNERLSDILQKKEVSQSAVIKETMLISKELQGTNAQLREKLAVREAEAKRTKSDLAAAQARTSELERQKEVELEKLKATYDELVGSLKGEIEAGEIQIRRMKDRLSVNLESKVLFDSGKADLKGSGIEVLRRVGAQLAKVEGKRIQIEGHSDNDPIGGKLQEKFPTNWELSASRALAVVHFLQSEVGIDAQKLSGAGYGEYQPTALNDTAKGKAANRRIEIVLLPPYERTSEAQESTQ
ncbi:MAG: OmpA family protein [bacterium]|nr:OmpA family protein [bacterium]MDT8366146.1 OmpA family protein [bacterium]